LSILTKTYSTVNANKGTLTKFEKKKILSKYRYFILLDKNNIKDEKYLRNIAKIINIVIVLIFLGVNLVR
jgi:hypothetical protein